MFGILRSGFVALACLAAGAAQAALLKVTYEGRVTLFDDGGGLFAPLVPDGDNPFSVRAVFVVDTSLGVRNDTSNLVAAISRLTGDSNDVTGNPIVSSSFTVAGITYAQDINNRRLSRVEGETQFSRTSPFRQPERLLHRSSDVRFGGAERSDLTGFITGQNSVFFDPSLFLIDSERSHFARGSEVTGLIQFSYLLGLGIGVPAITTSITADLTSMSVVAFTPGVPEPATWAMMLVGFAGLGVAARRRREAAAAAA